MVLCSLFISIGTLALYPQLSLAKGMGLSGTLWGPIVIRVFGMNATQVFIATGNVNQIPRELDEAAKIDGCGFLGIFWRIVLPLLKPLIATWVSLPFAPPGATICCRMSSPFPSGPGGRWWWASSA